MAQRITECPADVLRAAAVLGAGFTPGELGALLNRPSEEVRVLLESAVADGTVRRHGDVFRFGDEQFRLHLYESMPDGLRAALHRYAAKILDGLSAAPERIARHLLAAQDEVGAWEADWLVERGAVVYAREPELAVGLIGQVTQCLDSADPRHAALSESLALYALGIGRHEQAARTARGILTRSEDPLRVGPAVWVLALSLVAMERFEEA